MVPPRVTIREVAQAAGVEVATASVRPLLERPRDHRPTAVFAANDTTGVHVRLDTRLIARGSTGAPATDTPGPV